LAVQLLERKGKKMKPKEFVQTYWNDAKECERRTGLAAEAILAQAALESAWGKSAPGNMFFGEKDFDGINGNEQLLPTWEISRKANLNAKQAGLHTLTKVSPVTINGQKYFKYVGYAYFKKFATPADCFKAHFEFFQKNSRYAKALEVRGNAERFVEEIAKAGYATDPDYAHKLKSIIKTIRIYVSTK
jgi:flagellum-specific peptidoglycan hydrolase FlgJ